MRYFAIYITLLFALNVDSFSQEESTFYSLEEGLPSRQIFDIAKDQDGYIWLGTANGLSRFDGYDFESFNGSNVVGFGNNHILAITYSDEKLWLGTYEGIYVFNLLTYEIDQFHATSGDVREMVALPNGKVFYSDDQGDVNMIENQKVSLVQQHQNFSWTSSVINIVTSFGVDKKGIWWGRLDGSIVRMDHDSDELRMVFKGERNKKRGAPFLINDSTSVHLSNDGIWLNVSDDNLSQVQLSKKINGRGKVTQRLNGIELIHIDGQSRAFTFDLDSKSITQDKNLTELLASKAGVNNLMIDNDLWWFATNNGLLKLKTDPNIFEKVLFDKSASVRSIVEYEPGKSLVSTYHGLYYLDESKETTHWDNYPYLVFDWYSSMVPEGFLALEEDRGLMRANRHMSNIENITADDDFLRFQCATKLDDRVFLGSLTGLYEFNLKTDSFKMVQARDLETLEANIFDLILIEDQLYIGSDKGLSTYDLKSGELKNVGKYEPYAIRDIYQADDLLWIGTQENGLSSYEIHTSIITWFNQNNGLANNTVNSIISSHDYELIWVGTNNGLSCIDTKNLAITNYYEEDGITHNEFNRKAASYDHKGNIWMGGLDGITVFDPNKFLHHQARSAQLLLTGIGKYDGQEEKVVFETDEITRNQSFNYAPSDRLFRFRFALSDFKNPQQNRFRYRIEGLHEAWVDLSNQRELLIDNLSPGEYTLLISGTNGKGMWSDSLTLSLQIGKAYYQKWWFYCIIISVFIFLGIVIHNIRIRQIVRIERVRSKIARDLHDELGSTLTRISMASEIALDSEDKKEGIENVAQMSRDASSTLSDIVWSIDNTDDTAASLVDRIKDHLYQMSQVSPLESRFVSEEIIADKKLNADIKQNLFLIAKEAINNSVKYSIGTLLIVQFSMTNERITMRIEDDGVLTNPDLSTMDTRGNGLRNMRTRAQSIDGTLDINLTGGFIITVDVPIN